MEHDGFEVSPGVWVAEGAEVDPDAILKGPLYIGDYAKVEAGAELREYTVLGSNVVVREGAFLHRAVVHDNVFVGPQTNLRGCVIGKNTDLMRGARIEEGAIIGDECVIEDEANISAGREGLPVQDDRGRRGRPRRASSGSSRGQRTLFGPRGVSGLVNVEITPELVVRLASALRHHAAKGAVVTTCRDASRAARALKRAVISALNAERDQRPRPGGRAAPGRRGSQTRARQCRRHHDPDDPGRARRASTSCSSTSSGADLSPAAQRKLERVFARQEFRRAFPGEIGDLSFPPRAVESYVQDLLRAVDIAGVAEAGLKVVIDCAGGVASLVLPQLLGRRRRRRADRQQPPRRRAPDRDLGERGAARCERLGELVGVLPGGLRRAFRPRGRAASRLVDETRPAASSDDGRCWCSSTWSPPSAADGRVALPVTTTRVAEQVCRFHGVAGRVGDDGAGRADRRAALEPTWSSPATVEAGSSCPSSARPSTATPRSSGCSGWSRGPGSRCPRSTPASRRRTCCARDVADAVGRQGQVMRAVVEAAGGADLDTTDGVRVVEDDGRWALVLPDPTEAITHLWAEGGTDDEAADLLEEWSVVVGRAGR